LLPFRAGRDVGTADESPEEIAHKSIQRRRDDLLRLDAGKHLRGNLWAATLQRSPKLLRNPTQPRAAIFEPCKIRARSVRILVQGRTGAAMTAWESDLKWEYCRLEPVAQQGEVYG
jgi:hypothetical protein